MARNVRLQQTGATGPRTIAGKLQSWRNVLRHGPTAETIITVFENADDYKAFEHESQSISSTHIRTRLLDFLSVN